MFPYDPAHLGITLDQWWSDQLALWPIAAARRGEWWERTTVHVISGTTQRHPIDPHLAVSRSRRSGPRYVPYGHEWSWPLELRLRRLSPGDVSFVHGTANPADVLTGVSARQAHVVAVCHGSHTGGRNPLKDSADRLVVLRPELIQHLTGLGYPASRLELAEPSVGPAFFDVRRDPDRSGPPRLGFIGRLTHSKGADAIVPAIQSLSDTGLRGELVLLGAGDSEHVTEIETGAAVAGWAVRHLGHVPNLEVADHLATWDALFFPSRSEGFPRSVLEALAVGVPVVAATDVLPAPLASRVGVHVHDRPDLAAGLRSVLSSPRPARASLQAAVLTHDDAAVTLDRIVAEVQREDSRRAQVIAVTQRLRRLRRDRRLRARLSPLRAADPRRLYPRLLHRLDGPPRGRTAVGLLETVRQSRQTRRLHVVTPAEGGWLHRQGGQSLAWPALKAPDLETLRTELCDIFLWDFEPESGDTVLDVGAGVGEEVEFLSHSVGPRGRVIAVEAHPATCGLLRQNVERWGLNNVTVVNAAVSDTSGTVRISGDGGAVTNRIGYGTDSVAAISLPELFEELGLAGVSLLKMNIEGAERAAVGGMGPVADRIARVCISCHDFLASREDNAELATSASVTAALVGMGFEVRRRPHDPSRPWVAYYVYGRNRATRAS